MMLIIKLFVLIGCSLICSTAMADYYFNSNCSNTGDGTSWSCAASSGASGAWNALPANADDFDGFIWTRGDVYWIAGSATAFAAGTTFRRSTGTGDITLKKATESEHGTSVGWQTSYGTTQAVITGSLNIWLSNVTVDGVYRSSSVAGYGLKIQASGDTGLINTVNNVPITGFTISFVELTHTTFDTGANSAISLFGDGDNVIEYVYAHDLTGLCFKGNMDSSYNTDSGFENIIIEESVCGRIGRTNTTDHTELLKEDGAASNVIIRNNLFYDWRSTGGLVLSSGQKNWYIYNNIFTQETSGLTCGNGVITGLSAGSGWENIKIFNNTFANISSLNAYVFTNGFGDMSGTGNEVKNNLFYNITTGISTCASGCEKSNNWYSLTSAYTPSVDEIAGSGNPFTSYFEGDFSLSSGAGPIDHGLNLSTYFTDDILGTSRPQGTAWDIGAYEYYQQHHSLGTGIHIQ